MPASQHQSPKSDIEISQAAKKRPIVDIARERLGVAPENLEPYGHYKAKVSMDFVKLLQSRPNGKLILVSAITPTPAGEGKTTTTVGLTDALNHIGKKAMLCLREPSLGPCFGVKGGAPAAATPRSCRWRTSIYTSPATCTPSAPPTICSRRWSTITSIGAMRSASTAGASPGAA